MRKGLPDGSLFFLTYYAKNPHKEHEETKNTKREGERLYHILTKGIQGANIYYG